MEVVAFRSTASAPARPLVEFENVEKIYRSKRGDVTALYGINTYIGEAEFLSVLGPSGCGKSTLLRCLAGLERPSGGDIRVGGESVVGPPQNLGVVFQRESGGADAGALSCGKSIPPLVPQHSGFLLFPRRRLCQRGRSL